MKKKYPFILLSYLTTVLLYVGCTSNTQSSDVNTLASLEFVKNLTISITNEKALMGDFSGLAVDNDGNIYVVDTELQRIHIFSGEGGFLESIGREGKGPGEFENMNPNIIISSDRLFVLQNSAHEIDIFDSISRQHIKTLNIEDIKLNGSSLGNPEDLFPLENGNMLVVFSNPYFTAPEEGEEPHFVTVSEVDASGEFINKKVLQVPVLFPSDQKLTYIESGSISVFSARFYPDIKIVADNDGNLIFSRNDSLTFKKYNQSGNLIEEFHGLGTPVPFTSSDLDSLSDTQGHKFKKAVNEVGMPDYWPSFESILVDDVGRYWIKQIEPGREFQTWQILDNDGKPKWKVNLPRGLELYAIRQNQAYGIYKSTEELAKVYRYTFDL